MCALDTTKVRTVAGHLALVYRKYGIDAFQGEMAVILEGVVSSCGNRSSEVEFKLFQLAYKFFQVLGLPESHFDRTLNRMFETVGQTGTVRGKCAQFRGVVLSYLAEAEAEAEAGKTPELAVLVRTYLKNCPTDELRALNVDLLADRFEVTRNHLSRCFREKFGRTLQETITSERVNRAFLMLSDKEDKHTVQQIAELVGYRSVVQFRKVFREHLGLAPGHVLYPERY